MKERSYKLRRSSIECGKHFCHRLSMPPSKIPKDLDPALKYVHRIHRIKGHLRRSSNRSLSRNILVYDFQRFPGLLAYQKSNQVEFIEYE